MKSLHMNNRLFTLTLRDVRSSVEESYQYAMAQIFTNMKVRPEFRIREWATAPDGEITASYGIANKQSALLGDMSISMDVLLQRKHLTARCLIYAAKQLGLDTSTSKAFKVEDLAFAEKEPKEEDDSFLSFVLVKIVVPDKE